MIIHTLSFKKFNSLDENIQKLKDIIFKYKIDGKINLFLLGELIFTDYLLDSDYIKINKYGKESPTMKRFCELAEKQNVCVSFGYMESHNSDTYNSQVFIDFHGNIIHNHRKHNLTLKESLVFDKGSSPVTSFMFEGYKFSIAICYDLFSKDFRNNYEKDTDILLHSLTDPQDGRFTLGFSGRYTSSYYVAANRFEESTYNGHIGIYSSLGTKLKFSMNKEDILHFEFDPKHVKRNSFLCYMKIFFHIFRFPIKTYKYLLWSKRN